MEIYQNGQAVHADEEPPVHVFESEQEFNEYKASCEFVLKQAKAAQKLSESPAFQEIIMKDYFENEPKRLGQLMASGKMTPKGFDDASYDLRSIGHLRSYLSNFIMKGNIAAAQLEEMEVARAAAMVRDPEGGAE